MITVKADLHIHTVLSPCGDLDMSPRNIVDRACEAGLQVIGITDHNTTRQVGVVEDLAVAKGIFVLGGVEITTREEVHCLAYFPCRQSLAMFQEYLDRHLPDIPNREDIFGYQVVVDKYGTITHTEEKLLITALDRSMGDVEREVRRLEGLFIPAHVDKAVHSLFSQLGFFPAGLSADALEISHHGLEQEVRRKYAIPGNLALVRSSDAHYPEDIGKAWVVFRIEEISFREIAMALHNVAGRSVLMGTDRSK